MILIKTNKDIVLYKSEITEYCITSNKQIIVFCKKVPNLNILLLNKNIIINFFDVDIITGKIQLLKLNGYYDKNTDKKIPIIQFNILLEED
jgi:hypothetical protein